jgi:hypothetical protein
MIKRRFIVSIYLIIILVLLIPSNVLAKTSLTDDEILAKILYSECRGVPSKAEQAAVAWCILNRADSETSPDTIYKVVTAANQFAWNPNAPVTSELRSLANDVLFRYKLEKLGVAEVGRTLPSSYLFFAGSKGRNRFRQSYESRTYWKWTLPDPYSKENKTS